MIIRVVFSVLGVLFLFGGMVGLLSSPNTTTSILAVLTGVVAAGFSHLFDLLKETPDA